MKNGVSRSFCFEKYEVIEGGLQPALSKYDLNVET
jgi:hypothetical protein